MGGRTGLYTDWLEGFNPSDAGIINAIAGVIILDSSLTEAIYIQWLERKRERSCYNWKRIVMRPLGRNASASGPKSMTSSIPYMTIESMRVNEHTDTHRHARTHT